MNPSTAFGTVLADELARCGLCGAPLQAQTDRKPRKKDGTRGRRYVCRSHREHHKDSEHFCVLLPLDAAQVDRDERDSLAPWLVVPLDPCVH